MNNNSNKSNNANNNISSVQDSQDKFKNSIYISFENKEIFENAIQGESVNLNSKPSKGLGSNLENLPRQIQTNKLSTEKLKLNNLIGMQQPKIQTQI